MYVGWRNSQFRSPWHLNIRRKLLNTHAKSSTFHHILINTIKRKEREKEKEREREREREILIDQPNNLGLHYDDRTEKKKEKRPEFLEQTTFLNQPARENR